jgi:hypothetical protein
MCGSRSGKGISCGGEYGAFKGHRKSINAVYSDTEDAVILALTNKAAELVDLAIASESKDTQPHPGVSKLRGEIDKLLAMGDPDLDSAIAKKTAQLNRLLLADPGLDTSDQLRDEFVAVFSNPLVFVRMPDSDKRELYREWVQRVDVDRQSASVVLRI